MKSKSKMFENRYYIECSCGTPDHILCFDINIEKEEGKEIDIDIAIYFTNSYKEPWYRRIKHALRYIFVQEPIVYGSAVLIDEKNIEELEEVIEKIKKLRDENTINIRKTVIKELAEVWKGANSFDISEEFHMDTIRQLIKEVKKLKEK